MLLAGGDFVRLVAVDDLEEGSVLGKTLYSPMGGVLLRKGVTLRESLISSIKRQSLSAVYIDDVFTQEIEIKDVIKEETRSEISQKVKNLFCNIADNKGAGSYDRSLKPIYELIESILDQIISNRKLVVNLIDLKNYDDYTFQHSVNVAVLSAVIGINLGFTHRAVTQLAIGALFHDVGKMFVPKDILQKKGKLTDEEMETMKLHSVYGFDFCKKLNFTNEALIGVLHHHEKANGSGYPHGRVKSDIHINAQIIAIADVYDAMTSKRSYKEAMLPSDAIEYIMGNAEQHFSSEVVNSFIKKVAAYPVGLTVVLSNGSKGVVCENTEGLTMRPKVKIYPQTEAETPRVIDLAEPENRALTILQVIR